MDSELDNDLLKLDQSLALGGAAYSPSTQSGDPSVLTSLSAIQPGTTLYRVNAEIAESSILTTELEEFYSENGSFLFNTDSLFDVYDLSTGQKIFQQMQPDASQSKAQVTVRFAISQDGTKVAVIYHGAVPGASIDVFDTKNWTKLANFQLPEAKSNVSVMTFSPSAQRLAVQTGSAVFIVDPATGSIRQTIPISARWLAISHDDQKIALEEVKGLVQSENLKIFRISDGTQIANHPLQTPRTDCESGDGCEAISSPIWTADDRALIFAGRVQTLHVWKPFDPQSPEQTMSSSLVSDELALSPDGSTLAISTGHMVSFFDMTKLE